MTYGRANRRTYGNARIVMHYFPIGSGATREEAIEAALEAV